MVRLAGGRALRSADGNELVTHMTRPRAYAAVETILTRAALKYVTTPT